MRRPVDVKTHFRFLLSVTLFSFSQAASVAILPSALFGERDSLGARWVFSFSRCCYLISVLASHLFTMTAPTNIASIALPLNEGSRTTAYAFLLPFPALLLGGIGLASRNSKKCRRGLWSVGGGIVLFAVLVGCGGSTTHVPPQNYTVTVTAKSGSLQHSTTVMLTVQ